MHVKGLVRRVGCRKGGIEGGNASCFVDVMWSRLCFDDGFYYFSPKYIIFTKTNET